MSSQPPWVFLAGLFFSIQVMANNQQGPEKYEDPFSEPSFSESLEQKVPTKNTHLEANSIASGTVDDPRFSTHGRLFYYHQFNQVSEGKDYSIQQLALDVQAQANWGENFQGVARLAAVDTDSESAQQEVLEAYGSWTTNSKRYGLQGGRIKPQWSNGYNWNLANLLRPYRDRPYLDADNLQQLKGWDLIKAHVNQGSWQIAAYWVELSKVSQTATTQHVLRMAYTGNLDASWLVYQVPGSKPAWAANISSALGDHWTLRAEGAVEQTRDQSQTPLSHEQNQYLKVVAGLGYQSLKAGQFSFEYLYNQHGYSDKEWAFIEELMAASSSSTTEAGGNSEQASGQLRKHYVYLQYLSEESWNMWQYRQSLQVNLDDHSQLHRLEVNKAFNDSLSTRFQVEYFSGCSTCEYGLANLNTTSRLAVYWSF